MTAVRPLVLASASRARGTLLRAAGLSFEQVASGVDEDAVKDRLSKVQATPDDIAADLARVKALAVAAMRPGALVVGADQVLECGGRSFDKPVGRDGAREHLRQFRGRDHRLISAVAVAAGDDVLWTAADDARLVVRDFSDAFLEHYLDTAGPDILDSVGAYRLEDIGAQLFDRVEGDYFTVLGLPLLPLLGYLRRAGVVPT